MYEVQEDTLCRYLTLYQTLQRYSQVHESADISQLERDAPSFSEGGLTLKASLETDNSGRLCGLSFGDGSPFKAVYTLTAEDRLCLSLLWEGGVRPILPRIPDRFQVGQEEVLCLRVYASFPPQEGVYADFSAVMSLRRELQENLPLSDIQEDLHLITDYFSFKGFGYDPGILEIYYLALKTRPFVILSGLSGGGKSRLARLFAEALGSTVENGRYLMLSVKPDWADASELLGHTDLEGRFIPGALLPFMERALHDPKHLYFLTLDEINLARTEYYLSDILSIMETRRHTAEGIVTDPLLSPAIFGRDEEARHRYGDLTLPANLMITGCCNMDESTYPLSRRVLDRAWVIEILPVDLTPPVSPDYVPVPLVRDSEWLTCDYLSLSDLPARRDALIAACAPFQQINRVLSSFDRPMGYRTRDELLFFLTYNRRFDLFTHREAIDLALLHKLLPRLGGSHLKPLLCELFSLFAGNVGVLDADREDLVREMTRILSTPGCKYPQSAAKILWMIRRCEEDGFTSYWF